MRSLAMVSMPPDPQQGSQTVRTTWFWSPAFGILCQQQVDHQVDDVARREVLAGVLVQRLVELADQFLEDVPISVGDRPGAGRRS
jgi:hypothetical protein